MKLLRIGIAGTRGIPNAYGGFEQFAQYLSGALINKGHDVTVYNSSLHPYKENEWQGVKIIHCRDWESVLGTAGQFFYDRNCIMDARKRDFNILLHLGYTSSSIWRKKWPKQSCNIVNMDGMEWSRPKYSALTKRFLKKAEAWAARHADHLIADSIPIKEYLFKTYDKIATYIPYGAEIFTTPDPSILETFDLTPNEYYLLIARMEPDNSIEMIIRGCLEAMGNKQLAIGSKQLAVGSRQLAGGPLVIVGNTENKYGKYIMKKYQHEGLRFMGSIYDTKSLNNLRYYSAKYFHGHSAGGTNPSLLEAMACGCDIACHDNVFNRAVTGENADYFSTAEEICKILRADHDVSILEKRKALNLQKIKEEYNWAKIVQGYEKLMFRLLGKNSMQ
jgi:glycosyltransferase involved in cell wall biosynthesis